MVSHQGGPGAPLYCVCFLKSHWKLYDDPFIIFVIDYKIHPFSPRHTSITQIKSLYSYGYMMLYLLVLCFSYGCFCFVHGYVPYVLIPAYSEFICIFLVN